MKILVLTSVYKDDSLGNRDRSTNIVNSFVHSWKAQGHDVVVIHNAHCYPAIVHKIPSFIKNNLAVKMGFAIADYDAVKEKTYIDDDVNVYRFPIKKYIPHKAPSEQTIHKQTKKITRIIEEIGFVPDVITGHWASPQMEIILRLKKIYKCKTACVLHGTGYVDDPAFDAKKYLLGIDNLGCRSLSQAKQVKEILHLSELPFVCNSGVPDIYVKKYGLDTQKFHSIKKWKFAYVGRLVAYKNIDASIRALSKIRNIDWEFEIVGEGAARKELENLTTSLHLEDRIHFRGKVSRDEVMQILKDTHIFVMISTNEIFGLVYLEAMAASCITIASKDGGVDGIIIDNQNGYLCQEGNSDELYNIIDKILKSDENNISSVVEFGYNTALNHTDSIVSERYLSCITD